MHVLARVTGDKHSKATDADMEEFKQLPKYTWKDQKTGAVYWTAWARRRYVQLVAFRSSLRGKLHFAPTTNLEEAFGIYGVPCRVSIGVYAPITLATQAQWVAPLFEEFAWTVESAEPGTPPSTPPVVALTSHVSSV